MFRELNPKEVLNGTPTKGFGEASAGAPLGASPPGPNYDARCSAGISGCGIYGFRDLWFWGAGFGA